MNASNPITARGALAGLALAALALAGGCAWQEPGRVESDFGNSVRQMIAAQIDDPRAASAPAVDGPNRLDGPTSQIGLESYRGATGGARVFRDQRSSSNPVPVTAQGRQSEEQ